MMMRFLVALTIATVGWVAQAHAHGDVGYNQGQCLMKIGPDTMSFTGYQPLKSRDQFCDDIPDAGPTIITLAAQQDELRRMNLEMRVIRDVGQKDDRENMEANTEYYSAPKKYKTGTLTFDHNFANEGKYIGIVKALSDDGSKEYVARFPFTVGPTASEQLNQAMGDAKEAITLLQSAGEAITLLASAKVCSSPISEEQKRVLYARILKPYKTPGVVTYLINQQEKVLVDLPASDRAAMCAAIGDALRSKFQ